jgi:hypothetical protein
MRSSGMLDWRRETPPMKAPDDLLYDSEASLRLVDHAIEELNEAGAEMDRETRAFLEHVMSQPGGFHELSRTLLRAYAETIGIVARMRESRVMVEQGGLERIKALDGKLREASAATESAAADILDGLGRAIAVVERLDDDGSDAQRRRELVASLRNELYEVTAHLQFQDITAQQLGQIAGLLGETRQRLAQILSVFAPAAVRIGLSGPALVATDPIPADPVSQPSADSQADADALFAALRSA